MPKHKEGRGFDSRWGHRDFSFSWYFRPPCSPGVDFSLWHTWAPGISPGGKGGRHVGMTTLPSSCADCLGNYGSVNLLEPSRPVQACNGIASPKHNLKVNRNGLVGAMIKVWVGRAGFRIPTGARDFHFLQTVSGIKKTEAWSWPLTSVYWWG